MIVHVRVRRVRVPIRERVSRLRVCVRVRFR